MYHSRLALLAVATKLLLLASAAGLQKQAILRPRHLLPDNHLHRRTDTLCGDGDGNVVDTAALVSDSVNAGLPSASSTGIIYMQVSVSTPQNCGPYACQISMDATGSSWETVQIVQNVPAESKGCGTAADATVFMLVAQLPQDTQCSGTGGACLINCKKQDEDIGQCAVLSFNSSLSSGTTNITSVTTKATTTSASSATKSTMASSSLTSTVPSSTLSPTSTVASSASPIPQGFSGENSPGGNAEQKFGGIVLAGGQPQSNSCVSIFRTSPVASVAMLFSLFGHLM